MVNGQYMPKLLLEYKKANFPYFISRQDIVQIKIKMHTDYIFFYMNLYKLLFRVCLFF